MLDGSKYKVFKVLRPRKMVSGLQTAFPNTFLNGNYCILVESPLTLVPGNPVDNNSRLVSCQAITCTNVDQDQDAL